MKTANYLQAVAAIAAILGFCTSVNGEILELRGTGTLPAADIPVAGVPGEDITVSVMLDSDDFTYLQVVNPVVHYFAPTATIPVDIVGSISGEYSNVSPIGRFIALELENSTSAGDFIGLDVAAGTSGTTLLSLSTFGTSGFEGDETPHDSTELFALFAEAMSEDELWQRSSSSAVFVGPGQDLLFLGDLEWSVVRPGAGDFDADGDTDGRDFLIWQRNPEIGELVDWQTEYGTEQAVLHFSIPEPKNVATLAIFAVCVAGRWGCGQSTRLAGKTGGQVL